MSEKNKEAAKAPDPANEKLAGLEADNAALVQENKELKAELKDAQEIVKDLKTQVQASKGGKTNTIKIGKDMYKVVGGFRKKEKAFTAEDIASNEKLVKELLEKGSGLIVKIK
ncbi:hypothetical protein [Cyclobacterium marinum]|uniref:Uncharacterized protein n=1 Tax=Cyclobacterium marinum (strain ATCC 25205 / DSM 745 / LMG 13164 / NCIMB 1802) TaxID=880070 RepID=G0J390_CYCMS|nr:hypothetical protein [Cyclobacterium marinum]AEL24031.1 hypothetical protein Cycma_0249 [Cyclobacterium marinum DSM 745]